MHSSQSSSESTSKSDSEFCTPLHEAAALGQTENIAAYVSAPNGKELAMTKDKQGCLPLHLAAQNGHEESVNQLLEIAPEAVDEFNLQEKKAFHLANEAGHKIIARRLLLKSIERDQRQEEERAAREQAEAVQVKVKPSFREDGLNAKELYVNGEGSVEYASFGTINAKKSENIFCMVLSLIIKKPEAYHELIVGLLEKASQEERSEILNFFVINSVNHVTDQITTDNLVTQMLTQNVPAEYFIQYCEYISFLSSLTRDGNERKYFLSAEWRFLNALANRSDCLLALLTSSSPDLIKKVNYVLFEHVYPGKSEIGFDLIFKPFFQSETQGDREIAILLVGRYIKFLGERSALDIFSNYLSAMQEIQNKEEGLCFVESLAKAHPKLIMIFFEKNKTAECLNYDIDYIKKLMMHCDQDRQKEFLKNLNKIKKDKKGRKDKNDKNDKKEQLISFLQEKTIESSSVASTSTSLTASLISDSVDMMTSVDSSVAPSEESIFASSPPPEEPDVQASTSSHENQCSPAQHHYELAEYYFHMGDMLSAYLNMHYHYHFQEDVRAAQYYLDLYYKIIADIQYQQKALLEFKNGNRLEAYAALYESFFLQYQTPLRENLFTDMGGAFPCHIYYENVVEVDYPTVLSSFLPLDPAIEKEALSARALKNSIPLIPQQRVRLEFLAFITRFFNQTPAQYKNEACQLEERSARRNYYNRVVLQLQTVMAWGKGFGAEVNEVIDLTDLLKRLCNEASITNFLSEEELQAFKNIIKPFDPVEYLAFWIAKHLMAIEANLELPNRQKEIILLSRWMEKLTAYLESYLPESDWVIGQENKAIHEAFLQAAKMRVVCLSSGKDMCNEQEVKESSQDLLSKLKAVMSRWVCLASKDEQFHYYTLAHFCEQALPESDCHFGTKKNELEESLKSESGQKVLEENTALYHVHGFFSGNRKTALYYPLQVGP